MSDLAATNCGCGCDDNCGRNGSCCGNNWIWILILLFGCGGCGNGCDSDNNCCLLILLLLCCGGCGNGGGFLGCGGNRNGCNNSCGCGCN